MYFKHLLTLSIVCIKLIKNKAAVILSVRLPHLITHFADSGKNLGLKTRTNNYGTNVVFVPYQAIMSLNTNPSLEATKVRDSF